jgi:putative peptide-modifying radical SAM enzyme
MVDFPVYYHLILTDDCNLCCSYCRAKAFSDGADTDVREKDIEIDPDLPADLAYDRADLYAFLAKDPDPVVTFYGGEPLLRTDLVREIMDNAPVHRFMVQTNGLLLHTLPQEYVNRFATILVSLDGREDLTDTHRGAGTYRKVMDNVRRIRAGGFTGELIARMTVAEDTGITDAVTYLSDNPDYAFSSIHWQLDANFTSDFSFRNFTAWANEDYNPGIRNLVSRWVAMMEERGSVPRWYPFLDTMDDLLNGRASRLRCGAGHANYSIMTDGHIAPCPVMIGMKKYYLGHIATADPAALPEVGPGGECTGCDIRLFCGGRCLYANIVEPWGVTERKSVCGTVANLHDALAAALPTVRSLLEAGTIRRQDFCHEKYNGCEIIP